MTNKSTITNVAEARFAAELTACGKTWFHQPKTFLLPEPLRSYRPDFYVVEDQAFYEILGTRQAYSYARTRIDAFSQAYPHLKLITINAGAWADGPRRPRVEQPVRAGSTRRGAYQTLASDLSRFSPDTAQLLLQARSKGYRSFSGIAEAMGLSVNVFFSRLRKQSDPFIADLKRVVA